MKILVIRLSSLGDVLLTTPVVRCLKKQIPDAEIHYLTKESALPLLSENEYISRIWSLNVSSRATERATIDELRKEQFDHVVDLHNNWRSRRVRRAMHCPVNVYDKENFHKFLYIATKHDFMSGRHVVQRYLDTVAPLGVTDDGLGMDLFLPDTFRGENLMSHTVGKHTVAELIAKPYVVVAFGAQHATKSIPLDKLRMLCYSIGKPVILLGDEKDRKMLSNWGLRFDERVTNLCGRTSLLLSAAIISRAAAVISADSAMMHVAAALQRPVIALFGATDPAFGFTPFRTRHVDCVVDSLRCHPCSRMGKDKCPRRHYKCMHQQKWQQIAQAAAHLVENNNIGL